MQPDDGALRCFLAFHSLPKNELEVSAFTPLAWRAWRFRCHGGGFGVPRLATEAMQTPTPPKACRLREVRKCLQKMIWIHFIGFDGLHGMAGARARVASRGGPRRGGEKVV